MNAIAELFATLSDLAGEAWLLAVGGLIAGAIFGAAAQQSRFCLRAATTEFFRGNIGGKTAIWLIVFSTAMAGTQALTFLGVLDVGEARQLASPQSLSGAAIGGLLFGSGMILARGCASRLLVLSATGNLRALLSGLVFAVIAQASMDGVFSPARQFIAGQSVLGPGQNDLAGILALGDAMPVTLAILAFGAAGILAVLRGVSFYHLAMGVIVGITVPLTWLYTNLMSGIAFEPIQVESITFTGPSADTLMLFLQQTESGIEFDTGLVPGVFLGAFLAALLSGELRLEGFEGAMSMRRYLAGGTMMGFGGMLAGGCAVGAGVTGASIFALTAWVALFSMWMAAGITDWLVDRHEMAAQRESPGAP